MTARNTATHIAAQSGERNHMAEHPDAVVRRARLLHSRGYSPPEVQEILLQEGHDVELGAVRNWIYFTTRANA